MSFVTRARRRRGMSAVIYYNTMPDATTQALIAARGDTIQIETQAQTLLRTPTQLLTPYQEQILGTTYGIGPYAPAPQWSDFWNQSTAGYEYCAPMDSACVQRVTNAFAAAVNAFAAAGGDRNSALAAWNNGAQNNLTGAEILAATHPAAIAPAATSSPAASPAATPAASPTPAAPISSPPAPAAPSSPAAGNFTFSQSAAALLPPTVSQALPASLTSLPVYVWAAAAGAAYFLLFRSRN
jgi:hypothetical protein